MELTSATQSDITIITVNAPRIDASVAIQFKDQMRKAVQDDHRRVLLNLEQVTFVDSSGLGAIVAAMKLLGNERKLELASLTADVDKVFRLTRMDSVFVIHANQSEAMKYRQAG